MNQDVLQAFTIFGLLIPFAAILALANISLRMSGLRWLAYGLVAVLSGMFSLLGMASLAVAMMPNASTKALSLGIGIAPDWYTLGVWGLITGVGALVALTPLIRQAAARLLPAFDPRNPLHAVSLSFAVFLIGLTAMQLAFLGDITQLASQEVQLGLAQVWAQGIGLTLVGLAGIGLWTRRSLRETARRLGLRRPTAWTWPIVILGIALFTGFDLVWTEAWKRLDPQGLEAVGRVSQVLFGNLIDLPGALSIGITAAISEEIIYRGALQPRFGLVSTAALFAISHVQYGLSPATLEVFIIGLALGVIRRRHGLTACMLIHFGYNTLNLLLLPPGS